MLLDKWIDLAMKAILATSSRTTALWTALSASVPQVKGPWFLTRTAGVSIGFMALKRSTMTLPVSFSYSPKISFFFMSRVQGISL